MTSYIRCDDGDPIAEMLGFTRDLFDGYIEIENTTTSQKITLKYIRSLDPNKGNVQNLIKNWITLGFDVDIYLPNEIMEHICRKFEFTMSVIDDRFWFYRI